MHFAMLRWFSFFIIATSVCASCSTSTRALRCICLTASFPSARYTCPYCPWPSTVWSVYLEGGVSSVSMVIVVVLPEFASSIGTPCRCFNFKPRLELQHELDANDPRDEEAISGFKYQSRATQHSDYDICWGDSVSFQGVFRRQRSS